MTTITINPGAYLFVVGCLLILSSIVVGLIIGALGRRFVRHQRSRPAWRTILVAIAGAVGGTIVSVILGLSTVALLFQIIGATLVVVTRGSTLKRLFNRSRRYIRS